jgi:Secretion system C-terminal sorting domain
MKFFYPFSAYMKASGIIGCLITGNIIYAQAPAKVTAVFTHWNKATTATSYSASGATGLNSSGLAGNTYTYKFGTNVAATNNLEVLDSFVVNSFFTYHFVNTTPTVKFRRVDNASVTGLRKSIWMEENGSGVSGPGGTAAFLPNYDDSLERLFAGRNFNIGIDNNFQNSTTTNNNNIEREDIIFPGGISATTDLTKLGFVVFDRGNAGTHDAFQIAAIKALDASGNPSAYFPAVTISAANYGNIGSPVDYHILRKNSTDAKLELMTPNITQNRDGIFFTFSSLNIPATTTVVYGYSLFAPDVITTPVIKMVDYTNAANFPVNSDLVAGGLDHVAVTGVAVTNPSFIILPERIESFSVLSSMGKVKLNWKLGVIDNVKETIIERSADRINFSPILKLSSIAVTQTAFDEKPLSGENYYRLKLVGNNATAVSYSEVRRVNISDAGPAMLNIYPNPIKNNRFILDARSLQNETYNIGLFDMNGKLMFSQKLEGSSSLQNEFKLPDGFHAGIYMLQLLNKKGETVMAKKVMVCGL